MVLNYTFTNECLDAIVLGMELSETDTVLAILSSGDQAFAMLEHAGNILAVDTNLEQVEYALERKRFLEEKRFYEFLNYLSGIGDDDYPAYKPSRDAYFTPERMERIRQKLGRMEIMEDNIFDTKGEERFSRIYLSNASGYGNTERNLARAAMLLKKGGLLYMTSGNGIIEILRDENPNYLECLEKDIGLTKIANGFNVGLPWAPSVYRRRA